MNEQPGYNPDSGKDKKGGKPFRKFIREKVNTSRGDRKEPEAKRREREAQEEQARADLNAADAESARLKKEAHDRDAVQKEAKRIANESRESHKFACGFTQTQEDGSDVRFALKADDGSEIDLAEYLPELEGVVLKKDDAINDFCFDSNNPNELRVPARFIEAELKKNGDSPGLVREMILPLIETVVREKRLAAPKKKYEAAWKKFFDEAKDLNKKSMDEQSDKFKAAEKKFLLAKKEYEDKVEQEMSGIVDQFKAGENLSFLSAYHENDFDQAKRAWQADRLRGRIAYETQKSQWVDPKTQTVDEYTPIFITDTDEEGNEKTIVSGVDAKTTKYGSYIQKVRSRQQIIDLAYRDKKGVINGTVKEARKKFQYLKPIVKTPAIVTSVLGYGAFKAFHSIMKFTRLDRVFATYVKWAMDNPISKTVMLGQEVTTEDVFMPKADALGKGGGGGKKKDDHGHGGGGHH